MSVPLSHVFWPHWDLIPPLLELKLCVSIRLKSNFSLTFIYKISKCFFLWLAVLKIVSWKLIFLLLKGSFFSIEISFILCLGTKSSSLTFLSQDETPSRSILSIITSYSLIFSSSPLTTEAPVLHFPINKKY